MRQAEMEEDYRRKMGELEAGADHRRPDPSPEPEDRDRDRKRRRDEDDRRQRRDDRRQRFRRRHDQADQPRSRDDRDGPNRDRPVGTPRGDPRRDPREDQRHASRGIRQPDMHIPGFTDSSHLADAPGCMPGAGGPTSQS